MPRIPKTTLIDKICSIIYHCLHSGKLSLPMFLASHVSVNDISTHRKLGSQLKRLGTFFIGPKT